MGVAVVVVVVVGHVCDVFAVTPIVNLHCKHNVLPDLGFLLIDSTLFIHSPKCLHGGTPEPMSTFTQNSFCHTEVIQGGRSENGVGRRRRRGWQRVGLVGRLTSQQQASESQGRICSGNCTCCHTEIKVVDQTIHLTQSQYTDTRPTSPSADPITPGFWQGSHWGAIF